MLCLALRPNDRTWPQLIKEMLGQAFATPRGHKKMKPFFDHVISFSVADNRVWMRNYQARDASLLAP